MAAEEHAASSLPALEGRVVGLFSRAPTAADLGKVEPASGPASRGVFERTRLPDGLEVKVGHLGLEGSMHIQSGQMWLDYGFQDKDRGERAVLVQTTGNVERLLGAGLKLKEPLTPELLAPGSVGENVFLDSDELTPECTCIGDEFAVFREGRREKLRLQVASARNPCAKVDQSLGKTFTNQGVRAHCAVNPLTGFFFRILEPGTLRTGDVLRLVLRPHAAWNLRRVSRLLYAHPTAVMNYPTRNLKASRDGQTQVILREEWLGTEEELRELASLPELAVCQYREVVWKMLNWPGIGRYARRRCGPVALCTERPGAVLGAVGVLSAACLAAAYLRRAS